MPTWNDLKAYAKSRYRLAREEPNAFALVWELPDQRTQQILVRQFRAFDGDWIEFRSPFCCAGQLDPRVAAQRNAGYAVGAIAFDGEHWIFRHTAPLRTLDPEEFDLPLYVIALTADQLEQEFGKADVF